MNSSNTAVPTMPTGMQKGRITKYRPFPPVAIADRQWPSNVLTEAPIWCSVDLRDGNQALAIPMSVEEKVRMFQMLVEIGFKEIEVGFPAASDTEFNFMRRLVDDNLIPDDVTVQVLVQAREALIRRTFESLAGIKKAIVHIYNSTSPTQRRVVFGMSKSEIVEVAVRGTELVKSLVPTIPDTEITLQYSPESFSSTEVEFALEICEAVVDVWQPTPKKKMILNLPVTVEVATANVHADQIEWFCKHLRDRESVIISLHAHNDRGTGIAATELGLLAGADRVEGTLFGNGERTGNVDIVTLAMNMYTQGIDPLLDFSDINAVRDVYMETTRMTVHERHPYVGDLVFTAFSGSHQDAINKGMAAQDATWEEGSSDLWDVPYLPIDPRDVGRSYEAIIRINSQSGKGGVAYILKNEYGIRMPKAMHAEFGQVINALADGRGRELSAAEIYEAFCSTYLEVTSPLLLRSFESGIYAKEGEETTVSCVAVLENNGIAQELRAIGNGPIDAFMRALREELITDISIVSYSEHSLGEGAHASAIAFIQLQTPSGDTFFGAGMDTNIELASIRAVLSSVNRALSA